MYFKKLFLSIICGVFLSIHAQAKEIQVLAAASLKYVLEAIKSDFLQGREDSINISYTSSGKAFAQIKNGARVHLFISADVDYPKKLYQQNLVPQKEEIYAKGKLALWSNQKEFSLTQFNDILNPKITHIAIPNPKVAPYGKASLEALRNANILEKVQDKFVVGESVGGATTYVESKNAEVGFSALSMFKGGGIKSQNMSLVILDERLHAPIFQALVLTNYGKDSKLAQDFKEYILSKNAKKTFVAFGYSIE